jgi:putative ABC transport system permease protein
MAEYARLGIGIAALVAIALGALWCAGVPHLRGLIIAVGRAGAQLAFVAAVLRGVFAAPQTAVVALIAMFWVAAWTAGRRMRVHEHALRSAVIACGAGSVTAIALIVGLPVLTRDVRTLVAVSGIVFGGTMSVATLTGRRLADALTQRRDEVEAWLSLGATTRQAVRPLAREAIYEALVPALDQTRTVGLVTLPGAFVGALLGGVSAAGAAKFQLVVLIGLLSAETITSTLLAHLLGNPRSLPGGRPPT